MRLALRPLEEVQAAGVGQPQQPDVPMRISAA
jgi:hypothetical protein